MSHFVVSRSTQILTCIGLVLCLGCSQDLKAAVEFSGAKAFTKLEEQCAFGPRVPGTEAHRQCRDYLVAELQLYAGKVEVQEFEETVRGRALPLSNIIAYFGEGPTDWLLCAHWDSRPTADRDPDPANRDRAILGANDGASGVAVLLELARILHDTEAAPGVIMALFDGEDYGPDTDAMFLGSRYYAAKMTSPLPERGILLDMVGDRQLNLPIELNSYEAAPGLVGHIWETAERLGFREFERRAGYRISDDHVPLIQAGVPTVDIIDFDYPYWHTLADTPDKCSAASLYTVGQVVLTVILGH